MLYIQKESALRNETHKILWDFEIQINPPIPAQIRPSDHCQNKNKKTCRIVYIVAWVDNRENQKKKTEKRGKYLDLARERKKLWNMKVTVMER